MYIYIYVYIYIYRVSQKPFASVRNRVKARAEITVNAQ